MPRPGAAAAESESAALRRHDTRLLPWLPHHIHAADAAAKVVYQLLDSVIVDGDDAVASDAAGVSSSKNGRSPAALFSSLDPCGSYLLRTSLNANPACLLGGTGPGHEALVYPVDVTGTLLESFCSIQDVERGAYLQRRHAALEKVLAILQKAASKGFATTEEHGTKASTASCCTLRGVKLVPVRPHPLLAASKLAVVARFELTPSASATATGSKPAAAADDDSDDDRHVTAATAAASSNVFVDVTVHTRPDRVPAKVSGASAATKLPFYSSLVLEDHYAVAQLEALHKAVSGNAELSQAIVTAKLWARHTAILDPPAAAWPIAPPRGASATAAVTSSSADNSTSDNGPLRLAAVASQGLNGFALSVLLAGLAGSSATAAASSGKAGKSGAAAGASASAGTAEALLRRAWLQLCDVSPQLPLTGTNLNVLHAAATISGDDFASEFEARAVARWSLAAPKGATGILAGPMPASLAELYDAVLVVQPTAAGAHFTAAAASSAASSSAAAEKGIPVVGRGRDAAVAVSATLRRALADRVRRLHVTADEAGTTLWVAVAFTSEAAARNRLLRGAPVEDRAEVEAFDRLWDAQRVTSRQFADGGVFRCVVWPSEAGFPANAEQADARGTAMLVQQLVAHLIGRHHVAGAEKGPASSSLSRVRVTCRGGSELLDVLAEPLDSLGVEWVDAAPLADIAARAVMARVGQLVLQACGDNFPCVVKSVDGLTANAYGTEIFAPLPSALTIDLSEPSSRLRDVQALVDRKLVSTLPAIAPIHAAVVIDDKRKIPDTVDAIAAMKGAIAAQLSKALSAVVTDDVRVLTAKASVDVFMQGYVVRLHIAHFREVSLLRALERTAEAAAIERRLFRSAQHAKYIRGVVGAHLSAAAAMRLLKRWVSAVCMSDYLLPEAAELLVAAGYVLPAQAAGEEGQQRDVATAAAFPCSAAAGFLRALRLLAGAHAAAAVSREPLVLSTAPTDVQTAKAAFSRARAENEEQGLFIAAPYALDESPYTANTPRPAMLERLSVLAAATLHRFAEFCGGQTCVSSDDAASLVSRHPSAVAAVFAGVDCNSFDAVLPFTNRVRAPAGTTGRAPVLVGQHTAALRPGLAWSATKADALPNAELGRRVGPAIERDPAGAAVRAARAACREDALVFYDACSPTAMGVVLLRKRNVARPDEWSDGLGLAIAAVPAPTNDIALSEDAPPAMNEAAGVVKRIVEAVAGSVVAPRLIRAAATGAGKSRQAAAAVDTGANPHAKKRREAKALANKATAGNGARREREEAAPAASAAPSADDESTQRPLVRRHRPESAAGAKPNRAAVVPAPPAAPAAKQAKSATKKTAGARKSAAAASS